MSMFSVDINSANGANYIRPKKGAGQQPAVSRTPVDMTKDGSVFNDPNIFSADPTKAAVTLGGLRTAGRPQTTGTRGGNSIFNGQMNFVSGGNSETTGGVNSLTAGIDPSLFGDDGDKGSDDLGIGRDAGKGRAAAKELKEKTSDLKGQIYGVESNGDQANALGKKGKKLQASITKTDEKFKEKQLKQQAEFNNLEEQRKAVIREMDDANKSIEDYSRELESEIESGSNNFERIAQLRSMINEKNTTLTIGQSKIM